MCSSSNVNNPQPAGAPVSTQPPAPPIANVTSDINALKIDILYNDNSTQTYAFYGNQDKPTTPGAATSGVPIRATLFYANDLLKPNNVQNVNVVGSTLIQPPSINFVNKSDTTSTMEFTVVEATGVSVSFGFQNKAGIATFDLINQSTGAYLVQSGLIDLHSSSDAVTYVKSVLLSDKLDDTVDYLLRIHHTGIANPTIFDNLLPHPIYVGDVTVHRAALTNKCIVEYVSNNAFINNTFIDDGSQNSVTGNKNFVEFFQVQNVIVTDETVNRYRINSSTTNVRSVEINNGLKFHTLDPEIDWNLVRNSTTDPYDQSVLLSFFPKKGSALRITYDVTSSLLQRKIIVSQPKTFSGLYDRYANVYLQSEASYYEVNSIKSSV